MLLSPFLFSVPLPPTCPLAALAADRGTSFLPFSFYSLFLVLGLCLHLGLPIAYVVGREVIVSLPFSFLSSLVSLLGVFDQWVIQRLKGSFVPMISVT